MNSRVIKRIVLMSEYFYRGTRGASGCVRFGVPDLAKHRGLSKGLHENCDPAFAPGIPREGPAVRLYRLALGGNKPLLGLERFPVRRILPALECRRAAQGGQWIAKEDP